MRSKTAIFSLALLCLTPNGPLGAQRDSATVVAGAEYAAGDLRGELLGEDCRDLWTTPIRVPVLDLSGFAGGLTPVRPGGGHQTQSLRFAAENGREYNFRSVNKEITKGLPPWLKETLVDAALQDQTSSLHPAAAGIATVLLDSVGVLNPGPRLVVLPDARGLGEFRNEFAGVLGWIEVHANEGDDNEPLFANSPTIAGTDRMLEHIEDSPQHRVDARAYLKARRWTSSSGIGIAIRDSFAGLAMIGRGSTGGCRSRKIAITSSSTTMGSW